MTKSELIDELAQRLSEHKLLMRDVEKIVDTILESITDALVNDQRVEIRGFGSFSVRTYEAKISRNPKTGESVSVPKKRSPFWKAGKELSKRVDAGSKKNPDQPATPFSVGD